MRKNSVIALEIAGYPTHFSGTRLRAAIERGLNFLGDTSVAALIQNMQTNGFRFEEDSDYTLPQITHFLISLFGESGSELMVKRLTAALG